MTIPIITCIETCCDELDIIITLFRALELITGRYINFAYYYYYQLNACFVNFSYRIFCKIQDKKIAHSQEVGL